jgi:hypothetical protein
MVITQDLPELKFDSTSVNWSNHDFSDWDPKFQWGEYFRAIIVFKSAPMNLLPGTHSLRTFLKSSGE